MFLPGQSCKVVVHLAEQRHDIGPLKIDLHLAVLNLADVEKLIDQPEHAVGVALGQTHVFARGG